ncbi:MAG: rod shape-determining protein RodA [candidate division WOR-3 bacterium]
MKSIKWKLTLIPAFLILFGLIELYFIKPSLFYSQLIKVLIFSALVLALYLATPFESIINYGSLLYYFSLILLLLTLFLGKGSVNRWLNLGFIQLQPSELAKLGLILILAKTLSNEKKPLKARLLHSGILTAIPFTLTMLQPDLGTALTYLFVAFILCWSSGLDPAITRISLLTPIAMLASGNSIASLIFYLIIVLILLLSKDPLYKKLITISILITVSLSTPVIWHKLMKPYQRERLTAFLNPIKSKTREGWQIYQAKIALGSGGIFGKGPGKGTQKGLAFLPAAHTDFIFSSIGEEFGLVGLSIIIIAFYTFLTGMLRLAEIKEGHEKLIVLGIMSYFIFHFLVNIFSNLSLLPVVGIPLPFLTYGGSHLFVEMLSLTILGKMEV